ncbi:TPA: N-acyl-D-amino-acid deacylase family protein [Pluralibacter gergoviae]
MQNAWLFKNANVIDGSGGQPFNSDVLITDGKIAQIADAIDNTSAEVLDCSGLTLAPGFIDVHTHDDLIVIKKPDYVEKTSQGVTTVIVGNCGISAACMINRYDALPEPLNLLGPKEEFIYPDVASYRQAVTRATPSVNVGTLIGHTTLRNNFADDLNKPATPDNIARMREMFSQAVAQGALGMSTGLAYANAYNASTDEVTAIADELTRPDYRGIYTTHMRTEFDGIIDAMHEAFSIGAHAHAPVQISHHKCAGVANWGRTVETLALIEQVQEVQDVSCDCYPYNASSSNLDLKQVSTEYEILITWSTPYPDMAGKTLKDIAQSWGVDVHQAAERLLPAGAIYFLMDEADVRRVMQHPSAMIGSDGLPRDPNPHPRLWGTFPRVLGHYGREEGLLPLPTAIHKMTGMAARRFSLTGRGFIREGYFADVVVFDAATIADVATYQNPKQKSAGIHAVFVNGVLTYRNNEMTGSRGGEFLSAPRAN